MLRDEVKHNDVRFSLGTDWKAHPFSICHGIFTPKYMQTNKTCIYSCTHIQLNKAHSLTTRKAEPPWPSVAKTCTIVKELQMYIMYYPPHLDKRQASLLLLLIVLTPASPPNAYPKWAELSYSFWLSLISHVRTLCWAWSHEAWFI